MEGNKKVHKKSKLQVMSQNCRLNTIIHGIYLIEYKASNPRKNISVFLKQRIIIEKNVKHKLYKNWENDLGKRYEAFYKARHMPKIDSTPSKQKVFF